MVVLFAEIESLRAQVSNNKTQTANANQDNIALNRLWKPSLFIGENKNHYEPLWIIINYHELLWIIDCRSYALFSVGSLVNQFFLVRAGQVDNECLDAVKFGLDTVNGSLDLSGLATHASYPGQNITLLE